MSNDLQADLTTKLKGTGLTQASQGVSKLKAETQQLERQTRDMGATATRSFRHVSTGATTAEFDVGRLKRSLKGLEGPLGGVLRKSAAGFALGGAAGAGLGALIAVSKGVDLYNYYLDKNVEKLKRQLDLEEKLSDARDNAKKSLDDAAISATAGHGDDIRLATARIGEKGINRAVEMAKYGDEGIDTHDAIRGLAEASLIRDGGQEGAIAAARQVAATGEMSFSGAMRQIRDNPMFRQLLRNSTKENPTEGDVARRLVVGVRGQDATTDNLDAAGEAITNARTGAATGLLGGVNQLNRTQAEGVSDQLDAITSGRANAALLSRNADAKDPEAAARAKIFEKGMQDLAKSAAEANMRSSALLNMLGRVLTRLGGGDGSRSNTD